jgi:hypothetical protein
MHGHNILWHLSRQEKVRVSARKQVSTPIDGRQLIFWTDKGKREKGRRIGLRYPSVGHPSVGHSNNGWPQKGGNYIFLILWFYSCTHNYKNDKELIVQNDSIGGHINIITGKYAWFLFLCRHRFLAIVTCVIGTELWFC